MAIGKITAIRGVVVDVEFPGGQLPEIYEALTLQAPQGELVLEVQQHLGGGNVRTVAMGSSDGVPRHRGGTAYAPTRLAHRSALPRPAWSATRREGEGASTTSCG